MAGEIASAFVRIRPNLDGFRSETEHGVREAFVGIRRIVGGALAATGAFEFGKEIVKAAVEDQAAFAILDKAIENAGASAQVAGKNMEELLSAEGRLKGFSDEQLAAAMTRLVSVTHDSAKAYNDLQLAEDLSRARGLDLATAALAISKAEQGRSTALQRYGLIVPKVTAAVDALKKKHDEALISGAKFTASQKEAYKDALAAAKATDDQSSRTAVLTLIQERFGGVASHFADTALGQFQRLRESFHQLEETIGKVFIGGLATASEAVGNFVGGLSQNADFIGVLRGYAHNLGETFHVLAEVAKTVAPPLLSITRAAYEVVNAIGAKPILAAVAAYKSLAIVTAATTVAVNFYARAVVAQYAATQLAAAGNLELAASETAVAAAGGRAALGGFGNFVKGVGVLAAGKTGGPIGLALGGLAALTGAIVYFGTRTSETSVKLKEFHENLSTLGGALQSEAAAKLAVDQAELNVEMAKSAIVTSKAKPGTAEHTQLLLNQRQAVIDLTRAQHDFGKIQETISSSTRQATANVLDSVAAMKKTYDFQIKSLGGPYPEGSPGFANAQKLQQEAYGTEVRRTAEDLMKQAAALRDQDPILARNTRLLAEFVVQAHKIPTKKTISFFLNNRSMSATLTTITERLREAQRTAGVEGAKAGEEYSAAFNELIQRNFGISIAGPSGQWEGLAAGIVKAAEAAQQSAKTGAAKKKIVAAANAALTSLRQGLAEDREQAASIKQAMALQVIQGAEAVRQAVVQSKQTFSSIGQTIATDIAQVMTAPLDLADQAISAEGDRLALSFDKQAAKLQARANVFDAALGRIQIQQQARAARFAGQNTLLQNRANRGQLAGDRLSIEQLRRSVILPGGKQLSTNVDEALEQLRRFAANAHGSSKFAIDQFRVQYQAAADAVTKDKITVASQVSPKAAQRTANLELANARNALDTAALNARHAADTARLQIRGDLLRIQRDIVTARTRIAAQEIADLTDAFNRAPSASALKKVTQKIAAIMRSDHVSFETAGRILGTAFQHSFEAQITGLTQQGVAQGTRKTPGAGLIPSITKPLDTIAEQQRQADELTKQYRKVQLQEMQKQSKILAQIRARTAAEKFTKSLDLNPGQASKNTRDLNGTTG